MPYYNYLGQLMPETAPETSNIKGASAGDETVYAPAGASSVSGEGGGDVLVGSSGDNTEWITNPNDVVIEQPGGGIDTEEGWLNIKLAPNVENLIVHGEYDYAYGNDLNNLIEVDSRQWVYGGRGDDVLVGQFNATFIEKAGEGNDVIYGWNSTDHIQLIGTSFASFDQVKAAMTQKGADVVLQLDPSETLTFRNATLSSFTADQFYMPLDTSKLGKMTFDDEFNGNSLSLYDPSTHQGTWDDNFGGNLKDVWAYQIVSNGEAQAYTGPGFTGRADHPLNDLNPFSVSNGVLSITAKPIPASEQYDAYGASFSSGMINTYDTFAQKYGYFEIRAALPNVAGTWPAMWMMPHPYQASIEGDVFESLGLTPNVDYRRVWGGDSTFYDDVLKTDPTGFHTYGMMWTPTTVTFYLDGYEVLSGPTPANWTSPMALIVDMALGGWAGATDPSQLPATMQIDYVRAYALADGSSVVTSGAPSDPSATMHEDGGVTSGVAAAQIIDSATGAAVSSQTISFLNHAPAAGDLTPGHNFIVWQDGGAVYGAMDYNGSLDTATTLFAGSVGAFTGQATFLSDDKIALTYLAPDGTDTSQQAVWAIVFDPTKHSATRYELGLGSGGVHLAATPGGGFAVSWHAADGSVQGRVYDAFAYDGEGWYGPTRTLSGDVSGVTAGGEVIAAAPGGQQVYSVTGADAAGTPTGGNDVLTAGGGDTSIDGGAGNDTITGWWGGDYLRGGDGNDSLIGNAAGFDDINGNKGDDTIDGGSGGNDWLVGGQGNDVITSHASDDILYGNIGNDTLNGGTGNEIIRGGQDDDLMYGGAGNDWMSGDRGSDTLYGGSGADTFHESAGAGVDRVMDFNLAEGDRVQLDAGQHYTVSQVGADTVVDLGGGDQLVLAGISQSSLTGGWIIVAGTG